MAVHVYVFLLVVFLMLGLALLWRLCRLLLQPFPSQGYSVSRWWIIRTSLPRA